MADKFKIEKADIGGVSVRRIEVSIEIQHDRLTPSEIDIAERLLRDQSYREIAEARGTTRSTVASQVQTIFEKFGVSSASELMVALAKSA